MPRDADLRPTFPVPVPAAAALASAAARRAGRLRACQRRAPVAAMAAAASLAAALAALPAAPARAQAAMPGQAGAMCGRRAEVVDRLHVKYGETRRGYGLQRGEAVVEVYASDATGTWTIIVSMPDGLACLVAAGENWAIPPVESPAPVGDPA